MPRRGVATAPAMLAQVAVAACAQGTATDLRATPPDAVLKVTGTVPEVVSCLHAAYAGDPFRLAVQGDRVATRIVALGAPSARGGWRSRARFSIEVAEAGPREVLVALRTAWTLVGPASEVARLRRRVAGCSGEPPPAEARYGAMPRPIPECADASGATCTPMGCATCPTASSTRTAIPSPGLGTA